ncbi:MAG: drug/metabolite transporter (DMT)-like permease [Mariniblastus sp.]
MKHPDSEVAVPLAAPSTSHLIQHLIAGGIVLLGAVMFSTKAIMVKLALPYGIDPVSLLLLRLIFALPFYVGILVWIKAFQADAPKIRPYLIQVCLLGFVGYYLASYFDFVGLSYISASLERVILYAYPTLVLIISALFLKRPVSMHQMIAVVLCYAGIFIAVRFGAEQAVPEQRLAGVVLIFLSALTYAIFLVGSGEMIPKLGVWVFTACVMIVSAVCVSIHYALEHGELDVWRYPWQVYSYAGAMALFATVIPSLLISEGIKRIGASNASIIGGVGPISTIVLASIFLNEVFSYAQMAGTLLVICGVIYISINMKRKV